MADYLAGFVLLATIFVLACVGLLPVFLHIVGNPPEVFSINLWKYSKLERFVIQLEPATEPLRATAHNHVYKDGTWETAGMPRSSCMLYEADPDFSQVLNVSRYPWHESIFARPEDSNTRGLQPHVLYGTSYAQDVIFKHQHPASCEGKRFLEFTLKGWGPGSNIHTMGMALRIAMDEDRIFVLAPLGLATEAEVAAALAKTTGTTVAAALRELTNPNPNPKTATARAALNIVHWYDQTWCPGAHGWECWVLPVAGCAPSKGSDVRRLDVMDVIRGGTHVSMVAPRAFRDLLECSPVESGKYFYWWRAQATAYLLRFNRKTRSALNAMREDLVLETRAGQTQRSTSAPPHARGVAMLVRRGDKATETPLEPVTWYVKAVAGLFTGNQQMPLSYGSGRTFSYSASAFAERRVFFHSEDPDVMRTMEQFAGRPNWTVSFVDNKVTCSGFCSQFDVVKQQGPRLGLLSYMLVVEMALQQHAFVCALQSNWCRVVDELRMTVARKAAAPFIDISRSNRDSILCPTCYLERWR